MRTLPDPDCNFDQKHLKSLNPAQWMLDALTLNPEYVHWGPHEDHMARDDQSWASRILVDTWDEFSFPLDELNEVAHFYFSIERDSKRCESCNGNGLNEATQDIQRSWFNFQNDGNGWEDKLTDVEVKALFNHGRLPTYTTVPPAEEVNRYFANEPFGHDAINRWICVEARARHRGVYGQCPACEGEGSFYVESNCRLALTLWFLHPRKGASRGVMVKGIRQEQLSAARAFLRQAADRNAQRFAKV